MNQQERFKMNYFVGGSRELYVTEFGYSERYSNKKVGPGVRNHYLLHFEVKGHCDFCDFDVKEGDCCLLAAGLTHSFRIIDQSTRYWLCFGGTKAKELLSIFGIPTDSHARLVVHDRQTLFDEIERLFTLCSEHKKTEDGEKYALAALMTALPMLTTVEKSVHSSAEDYVSIARRYIEKQYHRPLKMEEVADKLFISEKYLCRLFKKEMGKSPKAYCQEVRMRSAGNLLLESRLSVAEVAATTGFSSATRFSQSFTQYYGVSPTAFRERAKQIKK